MNSRSSGEPPWLAALATMVAVQTATAFLSRVPPTLAPALAAERGWSDSVVGYLASFGTAGSMLFLVIGAPLLRRLGSIRSLQVGLVFGILGLVLLLPPWTSAACLASLLIGFGYGPSSPAGNDVLQRTAPHARRAMVFSIKQAGVPLGGVLAGILLAPVAAALGWRLSLVLAGLLVAAAILAAQPMRPAIDADRSRRQPLTPAAFLSPANLLSPLTALTASGPLLRLAAAGVCLALVQGIWFTYLVTYGVSVLGYDLAAAGSCSLAPKRPASSAASGSAGWRTGLARRVRSLPFSASVRG